MFQPTFQITPAITKALMEVEACRVAVSRLLLTVAMLDSLRKTARLLSTHYSTQIEGNRLSPSQVEQVLAGGGKFPGRERDETEVQISTAPSSSSRLWWRPENRSPINWSGRFMGWC